MADQAQAAAHWDTAYAQGDDIRSWYEKHPDMSLRMLASAGLSAADALIDVGGGGSPLTRALLDRGFRDLTVLDISAAGMQHVDQRMLGRLQIRAAQHTGKIGAPDLNKRHREFGAKRILNPHSPVQAVVLTAPASQRVIGTRKITRSQPGRSPVVISTPVEVADEQPPTRAQQPGDRRSHCIKLGVVERHHGNDRVKFAQTCHLLDALADQARMSWSRRIHTERVESQLSQAANQPAIATPDIENPGACWLQGSDNRVEVLPPSRVGHTPEPYPCHSRTDPWHWPTT